MRCQWKLFLRTSIFLTSVISTPIIETIISQLCQQGFGNDIASSEDFQRSLKWAKCRTSLTFGPGQGPWTLKRHAGLESHKRKAAWQSVKTTMLFLYDGLVSHINIKMRYLPGAVQA